MALRHPVRRLPHHEQLLSSGALAEGGGVEGWQKGQAGGLEKGGEVWQDSGLALLANEWHCLRGLRYLLGHQEEEDGLSQEDVDGHCALLAAR